MKCESQSRYFNRYDIYFQYFFRNSLGTHVPIPCTCSIQQIQPQTAAWWWQRNYWFLQFWLRERQVLYCNWEQNGSPSCGEPKRMCGSAEGTMCRPQKHGVIASLHTLPSNHQCNFSATNTSFQTFLLHLFHHWRQQYDLSFSVQTCRSYRCTRAMPETSILLAIVHLKSITRGLPGWAATGPEASWGEILL